MNASERLDEAISRLEVLRDNFLPLAQEFEDAQAEYKDAYRDARSKATGTVQDRDNQAEQHCEDVGLRKRLSVAKVRLEDWKQKSDKTRSIIDALRTQASNERVGI